MAEKFEREVARLRPANHSPDAGKMVFDLSQVIDLTTKKTLHIIARDGHSITGFVLTHANGGKCIVDESAVRWFFDGMDFFHLMHGDPAVAVKDSLTIPAAAPAEQSQAKSEAMLDWLQEQVECGCVTMCFELDGGVHVTLDAVGEEQRAARNVETIRDGIAQLMTTATPATVTNPRGSLGEEV